MAIHLIDTNTDTTITADVSDDTWVVAEGVYVTTEGVAIDGTGASIRKTLHIDGHVISSDEHAIKLGLEGGVGFGFGSHSKVFISTTATVAASGSTAIWAIGGGFVTLANLGAIFAQGHGILVSHGFNHITNAGTIASANGSGIVVPNSSVVSNTGLISSSSNGIHLFSQDNYVSNSGTISVRTGSAINIVPDIGRSSNNNNIYNSGLLESGFGSGVTIRAKAGEAIKVVNDGTITGSTVAVRADLLDAAGDETIINRGVINGDVLLGAGNDVYNGLGGTLNGEVHGGAGNDVYIVDDPSITLIENSDEGYDIVKARSSFELGANFEDLNLLGAGDFSGFGNGLDNIVRGNSGHNLLDGGGGNDSILGGGGNDTIYGDAGDDTLSGGIGNDELFGGPGSDQLQGGPGDDSLFGDDGDDRLVGGPGDDVLVGGDGNDVLIGNTGNDVLIGGMGQDILFGGPGADVFVFNSALESPVGAGRDRITGFSRKQGDRIDVSGIDADVNTGADDSFTFIGTAEFSGNAGELRYFVNNAGHAIVSGDITGNGGADFEIAVLNTAVLTAGDFLL